MRTLWLAGSKKIEERRMRLDLQISEQLSGAMERYGRGRAVVRAGITAGDDKES